MMRSTAGDHDVLERVTRKWKSGNNESRTPKKIGCHPDNLEMKYRIWKTKESSLIESNHLDCIKSIPTSRLKLLCHINRESYTLRIVNASTDSRKIDAGDNSLHRINYIQRDSKHIAIWNDPKSNS